MILGKMDLASANTVVHASKPEHMATAGGYPCAIRGPLTFAWVTYYMQANTILEAIQLAENL